MGEMGRALALPDGDAVDQALFLHYSAVNGPEMGENVALVLREAAQGDTDAIALRAALREELRPVLLRFGYVLPAGGA